MPRSTATSPLSSTGCTGTGGAFSEFITDVGSGAYPENKHVVRMSEQELSTFMDRIDRFK